MHVPIRTAAIAAASLLTLAPATDAQTLVGRTDSIYTWRGAVPSRAVLTVRNYNGPIDVRPTDGAAEVRAVKQTDRGRGDIQDVAFEVQTGSGGDVTICATYRDHNPCDDRRSRDRDDDSWDNRRSVTVAMTILVPRGAQLKVTTGNGDMTIERVGGDVQASTGNGRVRVDGTDGSVRVSTGNGDVDVRSAKASVRVQTGNGRVAITTAEGPVDARTGNGEIDVAISSMKSRDDMAFSSGSGTIRVTLPSNYNGELDASTGSGELRTDFDLKVSGRMNTRRVRATIGAGGPTLKLTTGSGRLELRKGA